MGKVKKQALNKILYITGTVVLMAMLAVSAINFARDARVFQRPVLSTSGNAPAKDDKSGTPGDYKTIKYKKPADGSSKTDTGKSTPKKSEPAATKPENTGTIPKSDP